MSYIFAAAWLIIGGYLIYQGFKNYKILILLGIYFLFLGTWWLVNEFTSVNMLDGIYANILRIISGVMLVIVLVAYIIIKKRNQSK